MKRLIPIAIIALFATGCYNDKYDKLYPTPQTTVDVCDTATNAATYSGNVMAIMTQSCNTAGCHDAATASGGYNFTQYDMVRTAANNGLLLSDINSGAMPQGMAKLSDCKIAQITYWVNHGAQNN